jgi:hypothetical protein
MEGHAMSHYARYFRELAPDLDGNHVETLAIAIHSTLNGLDRAAFVAVVDLARRMGPARLADYHAAMVS